MSKIKKIKEEKEKAKVALMGEEFRGRKPLLFVDFADKVDDDLVYELIIGVHSLGLSAVVSAKQFPNKGVEELKGACVRVIDKNERKNALAAADFALVMNGKSVTELRANGCVPIAPNGSKDALDYNPVEEKGNGFYFDNPTKWEIFATVVRALETYKFPYDWNNLLRGIVK